MKRTPEIVVISDTHLGTYGCHAKELLDYLKSINPKTLVLNGDIIDIWNFKKSYFPKEHLEVVRRLLKMSVNGTKIYYLTGNHDDMLRKFGEVSLGLIELRNKLVFQVDGKKYWIFHGDVFDASTQKARWLARLGGKGYDMLIRINRTINWARRLFRFGPVSFSANVKKRVKSAVKHISDFEETAIQLALENGYDFVLCGHIHAPIIRKIQGKDGQSVTYMNSGDWVEHLTALEYENHNWSIFQYDEADFEVLNSMLIVKQKEPKTFRIRREEFLPELASAAFSIL